MAIGSNRLGVDPCRVLAFGGIGAAYAAVGTALTKPASIIFFQNLTDATLYFSYDGATDHFPLAAGGQKSLDITANKDLRQDLYRGVGTVFYVKRIGVPTTGSVYITVYNRE